MSKWRFGKLREDLFAIQRGTLVAFTPSNIEHTSLGKTWWVQSKSTAVHVAESYGGKDLVNLIANRQDPSVTDDALDKQLTKKARRYAPPSNQLRSIESNRKPLLAHHRLRAGGQA